MATGDNQSIKVSDKETSEGHDVLFFIPVRILVAMKLKQLNLDYNIDCRNLPTSWRLGIIYGHKPETGQVFCTVTLTRTDVGNGCLNVFVLISYVNGEGCFIRFPRLIGSDQVFAGGKIEGFVEESRHPGYRSYIFSMGLLLRISMFVRYCHSGICHDKAHSSNEEKETHYSKM
ncbi:unnamed protein product [Larinioides sclopetarius]|uniref:Uncharacterized protein n=1 Tax=Larinioides sclopetarius TaxID=280406 RepID=A0AAV2BX38_9ARAC